MATSRDVKTLDVDAGLLAETRDAMNPSADAADSEVAERAMRFYLGGWSDDPAIDGAETWNLWRRLAVSGGTAVLVPRPLVRQAFSQDLRPSRYELDPTSVIQQLTQRVETLTLP
jgi:hypothetical protein